MSSFLHEVASYLEDQGIGNFDATPRNIFVGIQPAEIDTCVTILGNVGFTDIDSRQVRTLAFPRFQVVTRSATQETAADLLEDIKLALHAQYGIILPNWRILACHYDQEGGPIGEDDRGRYEYSVNFAARVNAETAA